MNGTGVGLGRDTWILLFPGIVGLNPKPQKAFLGAMTFTPPTFMLKRDKIW
jgi:hypothetical protein